MNIANLLNLLRCKKMKFKDVIEFIDNYYFFTPSSFRNGLQLNGVTENHGSCRVLYFAKINNLSKDDTLTLFAEHYDNILMDPEGDGHQNIRQFQLNGWESVQFESEVLRLK